MPSDWMADQLLAYIYKPLTKKRSGDKCMTSIPAPCMYSE